MKNIDKRMQWISVMEAYEENKDGKTHCTEYEICSEVRIPGVLEYGSGALLCGLLQEKNKDGLYTYTIRLKHVSQGYEFDANSYTREGYYFEDGLIGELIAIFSVYFQARFYLKATIYGKLTANRLGMRSENEFLYRSPELHLNYEMFSPSVARNWAELNGLTAFLDKLRKMPQDYHQKLIHSFYWYSEAVKEIGVNHSLFFIKMVSSVEALLGFIVKYPDVFEKKLLRMADDEFSDTESSEIKNWLQNRGISKKFRSFLLEYSKGFFRGGKKTASHCYIKKDELSEYAGRIYKARSKYLHEGRPMYRSSDMSIDDAIFWDLDSSLGMMADRKKFDEKEKLPRVRWFERIVNHCLKNFIKEHHKT